ncbi:hypothetical protein [Enterococcus wangshanyuanii]|uniref:AbrB family transcriptional regulator n=1 Tax=Enterococcus wangshanyuanii TaxID=2005703 RepID=A0ABQ1PRZ0_9ENTE|nr:hypothetical protein [Enterococcus wangshanyuanii]GGD02325.1 hypothetical protein GCM10011573_34700 [Enterococcus wangshanyuanii]
MHYPVSIFDSKGAQQLPKDIRRTVCDYDIYNQPIYSGDNIIQFDNGDIIQIGDFRDYVNNLPDSELIEFMGGKNIEVKS